jgi:subfamily B ATP-binding cassette protein HlyB/CyaB
MNAAVLVGGVPYTAPSPQQTEESPRVIDSGLICLVMLARFHSLVADPEQLKHELGESGEHFGVFEILLAAKKLGLVAKRASPKPERLPYASLPAMALDKDGKFFILARFEGEGDTAKVLIQDPASGRPELLTGAAFLERWGGDLILFTSRASLAGGLAKFDFTWFIPAVVKYRRLLLEVLFVSLVLQLFALVTPLFFQVVMDKVLVHRGFSTLDIIAVGLLVVSIFEVVLTAVRSYVFAHTSSRIDVELGSRLFRHLLNLPLAYFQARRVGDSVARVRELENIRSFLTGNAITVVLDLVFSVVFIGVMLYYSVWLTLIVVLSLPCYFILSFVFTPILRIRLNEKFNRGADNQSFLVESISGVDTVKAMAVEPQWTRKWDNQLAAYVKASLRTTTISTVAGSGVSLIGKLVTVATMWLGAKLVIEGKLTVGQLIAFNMLAGHVANPVMRLAQMWTEFQQIGISMERLGDILNTRAEVAGNKTAIPPIQGRIEFDQTVFRYKPDAPETLRGISLDIQPGEVVAFVGRSGSGKSTMAKLVQRMYLPERGRVLVDGNDLALADTSSLRRQIGVVLQENVLFNRTIRENIALSDPGAPLEAVIRVAQLAGAHDFIKELPDAYDTMVGEHGASLSGGQRQRIAIARALLTNPRILIFDEATSALDYESERIIQDNMKAICKGRTVLIIAHRLSTVKNADRIVVIDRGQIVEQGSHAVLLAKTDSYYARLCQMQEN